MADPSSPEPSRQTRPLTEQPDGEEQRRLTENRLGKEGRVRDIGSVVQCDYITFRSLAELDADRVL